LPWNWISKSKFGLLQSTGETSNGTTVYPFDGQYSLKLSVSSETDSVIVSQTLFVTNTPTALNFSGYANGDLFSPAYDIIMNNNQPFKLSIDIQYVDDVNDSIFIANYDTTKNGWQESFQYVSDFQSRNNIYSITINCEVSGGVGEVFFDNITLNFF